MKEIRKGMFETNSSSVHAICIQKEDYDPNDVPEELRFNRGRFGLEFDTFDPVDYLWTAVSCGDDICEYENRKAALERICRECGVKYVFFDTTTQDYGIDHSLELWDWLKEIFENEQMIKNFLFGFDSIVYSADDYYSCGKEWELILNDPKFYVYEKDS